MRTAQERRTQQAEVAVEQFKAQVLYYVDWLAIVFCGGNYIVHEEEEW